MRLASTCLVQLLLRRRLLIRKMLQMRHLKKNSGKYKNRFWVRKIYSERKQKGEFKTLVKDLPLHDGFFFFNYIRVSHTIFEELLTWIAPYIQKQETKMREPFSTRKKTLRCIEIFGHWRCAGYKSGKLSYESSHCRKNNK